MSVLLTGATDLAGWKILPGYLKLPDAPVSVALRPRDRGGAEPPVEEAPASFFGSHHRHQDRVLPLRADIEQPGLGLDRSEREALAEQVTHIVHCAASVSFALPLEQSRQVNVDGTRHVLELAELCQHRARLD